MDVVKLMQKHSTASKDCGDVASVLHIQYAGLCIRAKRYVADL